MTLPPASFRWRGRLFLADPTDQSDLDELVAGFDRLGHGTLSGSDDVAVVALCDRVAAVCQADARERRRVVESYSRRANDLRLLVAALTRMGRKSKRAAALVESSVTAAATTRPPSVADRPLFDPAFAALDVVQSLRDDIDDLTEYWSAELRPIDAILPTLTDDADLADERLSCVRAIGRAFAMTLALGFGQDD